MRLQEPDYQSRTGYQEYEYPDELLRVFLNRVRQGAAWRTRPQLMQQMVNDLDQALSRCRQDGRAVQVVAVPVPRAAAREIPVGEAGAPMVAKRKPGRPKKAVVAALAP